ncbi:MAG TPA: hypothetical protein PKD85_10285, partial [Saprospiraceae bacterium]|nr:hypothetical protein [Saprospiraceae bacterium]
MKSIGSKFGVLFFLLSVLSMPMVAQKWEGNREEVYKRIKAEKIAYFTEKLSLTEDEAAKFWPIYNQYEKENIEILQQMRGHKFNFEEMSDADADNYMKKHLEIKEKEFQIEKSYLPKFKSVLTSKKAAG